MSKTISTFDIVVDIVNWHRVGILNDCCRLRCRFRMSNTISKIKSTAQIKNFRMSTKMSNTLLTYDVQNGSVFSTLAYDVDFRQKIDIVLEKVRCRHNVKPIWHCTNWFTASHYLHYHYFVKENYFSNAYFQSILLPRTFGEDIYDFFLFIHHFSFCPHVTTNHKVL